jgi:hypothetical protein
LPGVRGSGPDRGSTRRFPGRGRPAAPVAVLLAAAWAAAATPARAADPELEWRTFETPHFRVNFPDHLERVARRIVRKLEAAHRVLVPLLDYEPTEIAEVVVTDDTDSANGSTQVLPSNVLRFYAMPPFDFSPLQEYDDWLNLLVTHEYTHLLHLDNIGGLASVVNAIFGKTWAPNHMSPYFVIEGYTTFQESRGRREGERRAGRIGSTLWEMYLRAAALEDELLTLSQAIHVPHRFPHGEISYLYGGYFFDYVARRHGEQAFAALADDYGSDLIPFGISRALYEATGEDLLELWDGMTAELATRFEAQAEAVRAAGLVEGTRVVTDAETVRSPRYSPDGRRLGYFAYDGYDPPALQALDLATGERERLRVTPGQAELSWAPDGRSFVYHRVEIYRAFYGFYDLFQQTADGEELRLTEGLRAREPDLNRAGDRVACVLSAHGGSYLATLNPDGTGTEIVLSGDEESQLFSPRWSPDGRTIAFAAWLPGGRRDLFLFEPETKRLRRLTDDDAYDSSPAFAPDGTKLFFSSDRTGIANVYAMELETGRTWRVTNVLGGAFQPDVSPDGTQLAFVGFVARGYDLRTLELDPEAWVEVEASTPVEVDGLHGTVEPVEDLAPGAPRSRPYDPWQTAAPRAWWIEANTGGDQPVLTFSALGADVAFHHALSAALDVGLFDGDLGYGVGYGYHGWYPSLSLGHWYNAQPREDLRIDGDEAPWLQRTYGARAEVSVPFAHGDWGQWYTLNYRFEYSEPDGGEFEYPLDPNHVGPDFPDVGVLSGFTLSWYFSNIRGGTYAAGNTYGVGLGTDVHLSHPALGSDFEVLEVRGGVTGYVRMPYARSHSVAARLAGGMGRSDFRSRGIFFLGGFPEQDFFRGIFYGESMGATPLRGYEPYAIYGSRYAQLNFEYRLPIYDVDWGLWALPAFLRRLSATAFCDVGAASWGELTWDDVKVGTGAELFVEMSLGWYLEFSLRVGYAYGFMDPGGHDFYVVLGSPF